MGVVAALVVCLTVILPSRPSLGLEPGESLSDPALEARARRLSAELRCVVCQNQSIDDSNAPLARDLRLLVRAQLSAGKSDTEVLDHIVARYGTFVLLRPPFNPATWLLWLAPAGLLLGTGWFLWHRRRPVAAAAPGPLSPEEQIKLDRLLDRS
jgi:cytochrome c-type biogenesis protein CcmH